MQGKGLVKAPSGRGGEGREEKVAGGQESAESRLLTIFL